jgi:hypothetical protein
MVSDKIKAYQKEWRRTHRDEQKAYYLAYRAKYPRRISLHARGITRPLSEATETGVYLGVHIAERVLSRFFDNIKRMPYGNPGYDFSCGRGFSIDSKCSCIRHPVGRSPNWQFQIRKNDTADYFLCLAFDNRESLEPQHVWLIPGNVVCHLTGLTISNIPSSLAKWSKYERPLDRVEKCCAELRQE